MNLRLISAILSLGVTSGYASEAWVLEMPTKYGDYILKKSKAGEWKTVQKTLRKFEPLIADGTIKVIEKIEWESTSGEKSPQREVALEDDPDEKMTVGSFYQTYEKSQDDIRELKMVPELGKVGFHATMTGTLGKWWCPTFVVRRDGKMKILLERDEEADENFVVPEYRTGMLWRYSDEGEGVSAEWWSDSDMEGYIFEYGEWGDLIEPLSQKKTLIGSKVEFHIKGADNGNVFFESVEKEEAPNTYVTHMRDIPLSIKDGKASGVFSKVRDVYQEKGKRTQNTSLGNVGKWIMTTGEIAPKDSEEESEDE